MAVTTTRNLVRVSNPDALLARWLDRLNRKGGFTVSARYGNYAVSGFAVSVNPECERVIQGPVSVEDLRDYAFTHAALLVRDGKYLGAWRDSETGLTYLDVVTVAHSRAEARSLALQHNQLAFYDLSSGVEVRV